MARLSPIFKPSKRRGATLVEAATAALIGTTVLGSAVAVLISGMGSWYRGEGQIRAETQSQRAVRLITAELREAMSVSVDANGQGVNYRLPAVDANGNYVVPATWDNVNRRIALEGNVIRLYTGGSERIIARNVITTDPRSVGGIGTYQVFTRGAGTIVRQLNVMVVTRTNEFRTQNATSRSRETIFLRNIPELSRG